ncbi:hypothetical protein [Oceanobacillus manasiensis]|nr:hypothetical protein [Oceanobacillus manasiensis]
MYFKTNDGVDLYYEVSGEGPPACFCMEDQGIGVKPFSITQVVF